MQYMIFLCDVQSVLCPGQRSLSACGRTGQKVYWPKRWVQIFPVSVWIRKIDLKQAMKEFVGVRWPRNRKSLSFSQSGNVWWCTTFQPAAHTWDKNNVHQNLLHAQDETRQANYQLTYTQSWKSQLSIVALDSPNPRALKMGHCHQHRPEQKLPSQCQWKCYEQVKLCKYTTVLGLTVMAFIVPKKIAASKFVPHINGQVATMCYLTDGWSDTDRNKNSHFLTQVKKLRTNEKYADSQYPHRTG